MSSGVRKRTKAAKATSAPVDNVSRPKITKGAIQSTVTPSDSGNDVVNRTFNIIWIIIGLIILYLVVSKYTWYIYIIHENNMWFSNIQEVEREISFRTESGLYYSYFKQLVKAPTFLQGLRELKEDKITEYTRTINILQRFNIYQEVALAFLYRFIPFQSLLPSGPIFFYIYSVFCLQGLLMGVLYLTAWFLSGNWIAGLVSALLFALNRVYMTRVSYTIPLRESFSLPFLWSQILSTTLYIASTQDTSKLKRVTYICCIFLSTFLLTVTWQFNQFLLLLEAMPLFGIWLLNILPTKKMMCIMACHCLALFAVFILQFGNTMLLGSLVLSFYLSAFVLICLRVNDVVRGREISSSRSSQWMFWSRLMNTFAVIFIVCAATLLVNFVIKVLILRLDSDEHIFKYLQNKFSGEIPRDFDARLYLALDIFQFLDPEVIFSLTFPGIVFPLYAVVHAVIIYLLLKYSLLRWWFMSMTSTWQSNKIETKSVEKSIANVTTEEPPTWDIVWIYHAVQCGFFALLAILTARMVYVWTPYMCLLAGAGFTSTTLSQFLATHLSNFLPFLRSVRHKLLSGVIAHLNAVFIISLLLSLKLGPALKELDELTEFYDPDTVDLMNWINTKTPRDACFSGSMQLLAGVKLCTERPISNHPHYEDKGLRERTKELYQYYARRSPRDVHKIMKKYDVSYIILEDSICIIPQTHGNRLVDTLDIDNGHKTDYNNPDLPGLKEGKEPRFCDEIRHGGERYTRLFKTVFENKTFRVYKVL